MQAITQSMYAIGVPAFALQAIKAVVVIIVILCIRNKSEALFEGSARRKRGVAMMQQISNFLSKNRKFIPLMSTALLALAAYGIGAISSWACGIRRCFFNLFRNSSYLLISAIGMTFVILTGGIDLSVSGVVALTTVSSAVLLREGWNPWLVILLMLVMGMALGAVMGSFIVIPESPALYRHPGGHVVCPRHVFLHQR